MYRSPPCCYSCCCYCCSYSSSQKNWQSRKVTLFPSSSSSSFFFWRKAKLCVDEGLFDPAGTRELPDIYSWGQRKVSILVRNRKRRRKASIYTISDEEAEKKEGKKGRKRTFRHGTRELCVIELLGFESFILSPVEEQRKKEITTTTTIQPTREGYLLDMYSHPGRADAKTKFSFFALLLSPFLLRILHHHFGSGFLFTFPTDDDLDPISLCSYVFINTITDDEESTGELTL